eukprot:2894657-Rhodomonas_salina.2
MSDHSAIRWLAAAQFRSLRSLCAHEALGQYRASHSKRLRRETDLTSARRWARSFAFRSEPYPMYQSRTSLSHRTSAPSITYPPPHIAYAPPQQHPTLTHRACTPAGCTRSPILALASSTPHVANAGARRRRAPETAASESARALSASATRFASACHRRALPHPSSPIAHSP